MPPPKTGPLTRAELLDVWKAAVDKGYRDPLLAAGDGHGLEVVGQMLEQFAQTSNGIDATMQSLFITPWSGQTNPPAAGQAKSTVTLTFQRSGLVDKPLLLAAGSIFVEEETTDWGDPASVVVRTGRLYTLLIDLVFHPGDVGPFDVAAIAERVGTGFDFPLPGTIKFVRQPGAAFNNDSANVTFAPQPVVGAFPPISATSLAAPMADMFVPEHVGQQVLFTAGANAGRVGRMTGFGTPTPPTAGSAVTLEVLHSIESFAFAGAFLPGETIVFATGPKVGTGRVVGERIVGGHKKISYVLLTGTEGTTAVGASSGATATVDVVLFGQLYSTEVGAATWRVLGWEDDWGLTVTNVLSPAGGRLAMLDALGRERKTFRAAGEDDETYRARVKEIADVVSPNAIRRALYRVLGTVPFCFREVGLPELPGFFFDAQDAYDTDVLIFFGGVTSGTFQFQEPAQLETIAGNLLKAGGYFGLLVGAGILVLIRKTGSVPAPPVGLQVRGLVSGATFMVAAEIAAPEVNARRFRVLLDYVDFRAFFLVGLPRLSAGEFGFAYDGGPHGAYDAAPFAAFYDGSPSGATAALYRNVFQAVDTVRAGGTAWKLYIEDIGC